MIESRIERLIALDDYATSLGLNIGKLNIVDVVGIQNQIEKILQDAIADLNVIERFEQDDFDKRDIGF